MGKPTRLRRPAEQPVWAPGVTFAQELFDLMAGFSATPGHGHNYDPNVTDGWAAVSAPPRLDRRRHRAARHPPQRADRREVTPRVTFWATAAVLAVFNVARAARRLRPLRRRSSAWSSRSSSWRWRCARGSTAGPVGLDRRPRAQRPGVGWRRLRPGAGGGGRRRRCCRPPRASSTTTGPASGSARSCSRSWCRSWCSRSSPRSSPSGVSSSAPASETWGPRQGGAGQLGRLRAVAHRSDPRHRRRQRPARPRPAPRRPAPPGSCWGPCWSPSWPGMVFSWLRLRSGSVLAPMLAHLATNGVTLVVAWFALR